MTDLAGNASVKEVDIPEAVALKAGDYIKYNTGVTTVGDNGVVMFRVLYPMGSEYGLQIISDKNVESVTLGGNDWETGKEAYNTAIETLNEKAHKYVNLEYAYDGRCVGSIPTVQDGMFVNKNKLRDTEGNIQNKINTVILPANYTKPTEWANNDTGCYNTDNNYVIDRASLEQTDVYSTDDYYWLASRWVYSETSYVNFLIYRVGTDGAVNNGAMCGINSDGSKGGSSSTNGIRPCISLKYDIIKITGGDGKSAETAYTIGK